jgi:hypothetical protein
MRSTPGRGEREADGHRRAPSRRRPRLRPHIAWLLC